MNPNDPLIPIRRAIGQGDTKPQTGNEHIDSHFSGSLRLFDSSDALTTQATILDPDLGADETTITSVKISVNGLTRTIAEIDESIEFAEGDRFEIDEINFHSMATTGLFAAEGYMCKHNAFPSDGVPDYNDGRFSRGDFGMGSIKSGTIPGLANPWFTESCWDRLIIRLMHYETSSTRVSARFFVNLKLAEHGSQAACIPIDSFRKS